MNTFKTESDGAEYVIDAKTGAIHQLYPVRYPYNESYIKKYDTPEYRRKSDALMHIRIGYITAMADGPISSLLDVGYGNGAFMRAALASGIKDVAGFDISGVGVPKGCRTEDKLPHWDEYDVITFWDVLEHFPDLSFLADLRARMVVVSCPWLPSLSAHVDTKEFDQWHHRKPNEHLHHFNGESLRATMELHGWKIKWLPGAVEDVVRRGPIGRPNILTAAFSR